MTQGGPGWVGGRWRGVRYPENLSRQKINFYLARQFFVTKNENYLDRQNFKVVFQGSFGVFKAIFQGKISRVRWVQFQNEPCSSSAKRQSMWMDCVVPLSILNVCDPEIMTT